MISNNNLRNVMSFKKFISGLRITESIKDIRLNRILDKLGSGSEITPTEEEFLNNYDSIEDSDISDSVMLSRDGAYQKISNLLENDKVVICNLVDKMGRIGIGIKSISNDYKLDRTVLILKNGERVNMGDDFLYNIIYNTKNGQYSLEPHDQYYEKIPIESDED
jgi:hypothetical protein